MIVVRLDREKEKNMLYNMYCVREHIYKPNFCK